MLMHRSLFACILAVTVAVTACAPSSSPSQPATSTSIASKPQVFTWSDSTEMLARVPCCETSADKNTTWLLNQMFDGLVAYAPATSDIVPSLAEKWEISADRLTWTFHLRKGVTFSD